MHHPRSTSACGIRRTSLAAVVLFGALGLSACTSIAPVDEPGLDSATIEARLLAHEDAASARIVEQSSDVRIWQAALHLPASHSQTSQTALARIVDDASEASFRALYERTADRRPPNPAFESLLISAFESSVLRNPELDDEASEALRTLSLRPERDYHALSAWTALNVIDPDAARALVPELGSSPIAWAASAELAAEHGDCADVEAILVRAINSLPPAATPAEGDAAPTSKSLDAGAALARIIDILHRKCPDRVGLHVAPIVRRLRTPAMVAAMSSYFVDSPEAVDLLNEFETTVVDGPVLVKELAASIGRAATATPEAAESDPRLRWIVERLCADVGQPLGREFAWEELFELAPEATTRILLGLRTCESMPGGALARIVRHRVRTGGEVPEAAAAALRAFVDAQNLSGPTDPQGLAGLRALHDEIDRPRFLAAFGPPHAATAADENAQAVAMIALGDALPNELRSRIRRQVDAALVAPITSIGGLNIITPSPTWSSAATRILLATRDDADDRRVARLTLRRCVTLPDPVRATLRAGTERSQALTRAFADALVTEFRRSSCDAIIAEALAELRLVRPDLEASALRVIIRQWHASDTSGGRFALLMRRSVEHALRAGQDETAIPQLLAALDDRDGLGAATAIGFNVVNDGDEEGGLTPFLIGRLEAHRDRYGDTLALVQEARARGIHLPFRHPTKLLRHAIDNAEWKAAPPTSRRALGLLPMRDHNGAFAMDADFWESLIAQGYSVWLADVASDDEAAAVRRRAAELGGADLLVYSGHGCRTLLVMSGDPAALRGARGGVLDLTDEARLSTAQERAALRPGGVVVIDSCKTGQGRDSRENLANMLARVYPQAARVLAPIEATRIDDVVFDPDNEVIDIRYRFGGGYVTAGGRAQ